MAGQPVWLCSVSRRSKKGRIIGAADWQARDFGIAEQHAHDALNGVGDPGRERAFRMNITFCIHRALNADEVAALPACWLNSPGGFAGGPVQVLWSRGIEHRAASMPCERPTRLVVMDDRP